MRQALIRSLSLGALCAGLCAVPAGQAQEAGPPPFQTVIVTLDQDQLFLGSAYGQRVQTELATDRTALATENRSIEAELIAEEQALTRRRATLPPAEFAPLAEAFDTKVQRIRQEQERKSVALQRRLETARQEFLNAVGPLLVEILRERGAVAIVDRNAILLAFEGLDITDEAIAAIDARLGPDGTVPEPPADVPLSEPEPEAPDATGTPQ